MKHYCGISLVAITGVGLYCAVMQNPAGFGCVFAGVVILMIGSMMEVW